MRWTTLPSNWWLGTGIQFLPILVRLLFCSHNYLICDNDFHLNPMSKHFKVSVNTRRPLKWQYQSTAQPLVPNTEQSPLDWGRAPTNKLSNDRQTRTSLSGLLAFVSQKVWCVFVALVFAHRLESLFYLCIIFCAVILCHRLSSLIFLFVVKSLIVHLMSDPFIRRTVSSILIYFFSHSHCNWEHSTRILCWAANWAILLLFLWWALIWSWLKFLHCKKISKLICDCSIFLILNFTW